jgi:hypothetical protein
MNFNDFQAVGPFIFCLVHIDSQGLVKVSGASPKISQWERGKDPIFDCTQIEGFSLITERREPQDAETTKIFFCRNHDLVEISQENFTNIIDQLQQDAERSLYFEEKILDINFTPPLTRDDANKLFDSVVVRD